MVYTLNKNHVVLIDDNLTFGRVIADMLTANGMTTDVALSFDDGMESIRASHPDVILIDLRLRSQPVNGLHSALALRQSPYTADIPIIFLSGADIAEIEGAVKAIREISTAPVVGLQKPISAADLKTMIEAVSSRDASA